MALIKRDRENFWILNWLDEYMTGHKGFICGGCFKNIFNKEKVKDLDIFFENKSDFDDAVQYFDSQTPGYDGDDVRDEKYHFHYENDNVKAYKHIETGVVIELCCKIFGKPEEILNKFDFTITKFAYYKEEVTVHAEATDEDIRNLKYMSSNLYDEDLDMRLFIDKRVYDRYDLSNICMKTWDVVRKLEWKEKCDPAENEELFLWNLY